MIIIVKPSGPPVIPMGKEEIEKLKVCMSNRYDVATKSLNLSSLYQDQGKFEIISLAFKLCVFIIKKKKKKRICEAERKCREHKARVNGPSLVSFNIDLLYLQLKLA